MDLPAEGYCRLGSTLLHWTPVSLKASDEVVLDLSTATSQLGAWWQAGGLLGVRALLPLSVLPAPKAARHHVISLGAGAGLPALAALAFRCGKVRLISEEVDRIAASSIADRIEARERFEAHTTTIDAKLENHFHRVLLGCNGRAPDMELCRRIASHLLPEGQLILFGLPHAALLESFDELASYGFSLTASGSAGQLAFLSGSLLHTQRFGMKP